MSHLVAVDPGLRVSGVAIIDLESRKLHRAWLSRSEAAHPVVGAPAWSAMARDILVSVYGRVFNSDVTHVLMEEPQIYQGAKQKGDPDDLLQLAGVDGAIAGMFYTSTRRIVSVKPRTWKGQVDKDVHNDRVLKRLSAAELSNVEKAPRSKSLNHNVIDAVGLGLWALGRIGDGGPSFIDR